jgi:chromosome segregation ATPase
MSSVIRSLVAKFGADLSAFNKDVQNAATALCDGFGNLDLTQTNSAIKGLNDSVKLSESEFRAAVAGMDDWKNNADGLKARTKYLNDALEDQRSVLDGLNRKLTLTEEKYGEGSSEANKLKIAINNQTAKIKENEAELGKVTNKLDNFGKETGEAAGKSSMLGDIFKGGFFANIATQALNVVVGKLKEFATAAFTAAGELVKLSAETGMSTDELQEMKYVTTALDGDLNLLANSKSRLTRAMSDAKNGAEKQSEAFRKLGVQYQDANGNFRDSNDIMYELFDALGNVGNETERDAIALEIFGRSARELNPLIKAGKDELQRLSTEAKNTGAVMSKETVRALDTLADKFDLTKQRLTAFAGETIAMWMGVSKTVAEEVDTLTESLERNSNVLDLVDRYRELSAELQSSGLSAEEAADKTAELNAVKQQLIEASNGVISAIDLETGKFNEQVEALAALETQNKDYLRYQLESIALANTGAAAEKRREEALKNYESTRENYISMMESIAGIQERIVNEDPNEWGESWESKLETVTEMAEWYRKELQGLTDDMRDVAADTAAGESAIRSLVENGFMDATEAAATFGYSVDEMNRILYGTADALESVTAEETAIIDSFANIKTSVDALSAAYTAAYEAALASIQGQRSLFGDLSEDAEVTAESLAESLATQAAALANYNINLEKARQAGINTDLLKDVADGSARSAELLQAMAEASPEQVEEINAAFEELAEQESTYASEMAKVATDFDKSCENIEKSITDLSKEADQYAEMSQAGKDTVKGYIDGMTSQLAILRRTAREVAAVVPDTVREHNEIRSPSKVLQRLGAYTGEGYALGLKSQIPVTEKQARELAEAARIAATLPGSELGDLRYAITGQAERVREAASVPIDRPAPLTPSASQKIETELTLGGELNVNVVNKSGTVIGSGKILAQELLRDARRFPR